MSFGRRARIVPHVVLVALAVAFGKVPSRRRVCGATRSGAGNVPLVDNQRSEGFNILDITQTVVRIGVECSFQRI